MPRPRQQPWQPVAPASGTPPLRSRAGTAWYQTRAPNTGGRGRPQCTWGSSSLPPYKPLCPGHKGTRLLRIVPQAGKVSSPPANSWSRLLSPSSSSRSRACKPSISCRAATEDTGLPACAAAAAPPGSAAAGGGAAGCTGGGAAACAAALDTLLSPCVLSFAAGRGSGGGLASTTPLDSCRRKAAHLLSRRFPLFPPGNRLCTAA